ncbi:MAG TPA: hypothetical protein VKY31_08205, partial [Terriglobia bacterium]|nr:hypothetical protein [Terriglobia bacterium]
MRPLLRILIVLFCIGAGSALADSANSDPTLFVSVVNTARVQEKVMSVAKTHVEQIYSAAGIRVVWRKQNDPNLDRNAALLTLVIVEQCVNKQTCQDPAATGTALGNDHYGAKMAYAFFGRVFQLAFKLGRITGIECPDGVILGDTIAHELGHLLLPAGHSDSGLMAATMDTAALQAAARGELL